jgi:hypothetical protein
VHDDIQEPPASGRFEIGEIVARGVDPRGARGTHPNADAVEIEMKDVLSRSTGMRFLISQSVTNITLSSGTPSTWRVETSSF